jgi:hypothetical protein
MVTEGGAPFSSMPVIAAWGATQFGLRRGLARGRSTVVSGMRNVPSPLGNQSRWQWVRRCPICAILVDERLHHPGPGCPVMSRESMRSVARRSDAFPRETITT